MNNYMIWIYVCVTAIILIIMVLHFISTYMYKSKKKADTFSFKQDRNMKIYCLNPECGDDTFCNEIPGVIRCYNCKSKYHDHGILGIEAYHDSSNYHNPYNIKEGEYAVLDDESLTAETVKVLKISPKEIFAYIIDVNNNDKWQVMCCRLSPPVYYITFGQAHDRNGIPLKDYWIEIRSHKREDAQNRAFELFANKWANIYTEEEFMPDTALERYPKGCLAKYVVHKSY